MCVIVYYNVVSKFCYSCKKVCVCVCVRTCASMCVIHSLNMILLSPFKSIKRTWRETNVFRLQSNKNHFKFMELHIAYVNIVQFSCSSRVQGRDFTNRKFHFFCKNCLTILQWWKNLKGHRRRMINPLLYINFSGLNIIDNSWLKWISAT